VEFIRRLFHVELEELKPNFTPRAQQVVALADKRAAADGNRLILPVDVMLGILDLGQGVAFNVLSRLNLDFRAVRDTLISSDVCAVRDDKLTARQLFLLAQAEAKSLSHAFTGTEHLLLALLSDRSPIGNRLRDSFDLRRDWVLEAILQELDPKLFRAFLARNFIPRESRRSRRRHREEQPTGPCTSKSQLH
jgi:ATP-dependent Clp protease ATP-binding subunit ClpC